MRTLKASLLMLSLLALTACDDPPTPKKTCSAEDCATNPDCTCWCSVKGGYRKKRADDHPMWIQNDVHGKNCYCKMWDFENYYEKGMPQTPPEQPPGAQ